MHGEGQRSNESHVVMDLRSNESHVVMVIMDERMDVCDAQGSDANYFTDAMDLCEPQSEWEAGGSDTDSLNLTQNIEEDSENFVIGRMAPVAI